MTSKTHCSLHCITNTHFMSDSRHVTSGSPSRRCACWQDSRGFDTSHGFQFTVSCRKQRQRWPTKDLASLQDLQGSSSTQLDGTVATRQKKKVYLLLPQNTVDNESHRSPDLSPRRVQSPQARTSKHKQGSRPLQAQGNLSRPPPGKGDEYNDDDRQSWIVGVCFGYMEENDAV
jgi:hypothetical protein